MNILFVNHKAGYFGGVEQNIADAARGLTARGHVCSLAFGESTDRRAQEFLDIFAASAPCREAGASGGALFSEIAAAWKPDVVYLHKVESVAPFLAIRETPAAKDKKSKARSGAVSSPDSATAITSRVVARPTAATRNPRFVRMVHDHDLCCPRRHKYFALSGKICDKPAGLRCWFDAAFIRKGPGGLKFVPIGDKLAEMRENHALDGIVVGSEFMLRSLVMNGFHAERIVIVPPAVDEGPSMLVIDSLATAVSPLIDKSSPLPGPGTLWVRPGVGSTAVPTEPTLIYIGQLIRGKGVDLLLQAAARVARPFKLYIVGDGNARGALEKLCALLGLNDRVEFCGWLAHESVGALYDRARAVVVPSRWPEPFGMVGVEAMRHGRAVAAFDAGGIRDWLDHDVTGLLAPAGSISGLATAIERLLFEPGLAERMGAAGRKAAVSRFAFERQLDALERVLIGDLQIPCHEPAQVGERMVAPCV